MDKAELEAAKEQLARQSDETDREWISKQPSVEVPNGRSWGPGFDGAANAARSVCVADIRPQSVPWLLDRILPLRAVTLLGGPPKTGKSTVATELACCAAEGGEFLGVPFKEPISVLWFHGESEAEYEADYYHQRLEAEAMQRVHILQHNPQGSILDQVAGRVQVTGVKLVIIDTITMAMDFVDGNSQKQIEEQLRKVADVAKQFDIAIVGITHFGKSTHTSVQDRYLGSVKFIGGARALWAVDHVHEDVIEQKQYSEGTRALSVVATNKGLGGISRLFAIKSQKTKANPTGLGMIEWLGGTQDIQADDLFKPTGSESSKRDQALDDVLLVLKEAKEPMQLQAIIDGLDGAHTKRTVQRSLQSARKYGLVEWENRKYAISSRGMNHIN